jgi:hypothetical protein
MFTQTVVDILVSDIREQKKVFKLLFPGHAQCIRSFSMLEYTPVSIGWKKENTELLEQ